MDESVCEEEFIEQGLTYATGVAPTGHVAYDAQEPAARVGALVVGAVYSAGQFAHKSVNPRRDDAENGAAALGHRGAVAVPIRAAHVDVFSVDGRGDGCDGGVEHGIGGTRVRLNVHLLGRGVGEGNPKLFKDLGSPWIAIGVLLEPKY